MFCADFHGFFCSILFGGISGEVWSSYHVALYGETRLAGYVAEAHLVRFGIYHA